MKKYAPPFIIPFPPLALRSKSALAADRQMATVKSVALKNHAVRNEIRKRLILLNEAGNAPIHSIQEASFESAIRDIPV